MALTDFTIHATPGETTVTVDGAPVRASRVAFDADGGMPVVTVWAAGDATIEGHGIVQVAREPTPAEIDAAAFDALAKVDPGELERRASVKVRAGRRDVYKVVLETLQEMARG